MSKSGYIYFIQTMHNPFVKIGFTSKEPYKRLHELQTSNPLDLFLVAYKEGTMKEEKDLHKEFSRFRIRDNGEWFFMSPVIIHFIEYSTTVVTHKNVQIRRQINGKSEDIAWNVLRSTKEKRADSEDESSQFLKINKNRGPLDPDPSTWVIGSFKMVTEGLNRKPVETGEIRSPRVIVPNDTAQSPAPLYSMRGELPKRGSALEAVLSMHKRAGLDKKLKKIKNKIKTKNEKDKKEINVKMSNPSRPEIRRYPTDGISPSRSLESDVRERKTSSVKPKTTRKRTITYPEVVYKNL